MPARRSKHVKKLSSVTYLTSKWIGSKNPEFVDWIVINKCQLCNFKLESVFDKLSI